MMEKAVHAHTFVVALTYNDETEHAKRSAKFFDYKDIQEFLYRLRETLRRVKGSSGNLSFIAAGEQGSRNGRCHWHMVLFCDTDFLTLGKWFAPWGQVYDRSEIISPVGPPVRRRNWSLWPHGFVTVQEPDYGGMRYAMAYALKDQFNALKSAGHGREGKTDAFATGYFGVSKKPAIGARFIDRYIEQCRAGGYVPPSRKLSIPEVEYPWWPQAYLKDRLLSGLAEVNAGILRETGMNAAGWSTLLNEAALNDNDLEALGIYNGEEEESDESDDPDLGRGIVASSAEKAAQRHAESIRRNCGSTEATTARLYSFVAYSCCCC